MAMFVFHKPVMYPTVYSFDHNEVSYTVYIHFLIYTY